MSFSATFVFHVFEIETAIMLFVLEWYAVFSNSIAKIKPQPRASKNDFR